VAAPEPSGHPPVGGTGQLTEVLRFQDLSISRKLRFIITGACLVTVALTCTVFMVQETAGYRTAAVRDLTLEARVLATDMGTALGSRSTEQAGAILGSLKADAAVANAVVFDRDGKVFFLYTRDADAAPIEHAGDGRERYHFTRRYLSVWVPIRRGAEQIGTLAVRRDLADLYQRLRMYFLLGFAVLAVAGLVAYWLANRLQRLISQPILRLAGAASEVTSSKDYRVRVPAASQDEIGQLTQAFNAMLAMVEAGHAEITGLYERLQRHAGELEQRVTERTIQLQQANEELDAFGGSVSHDLRGPLRHIEGFAQAALEDHAAELSPEVRGYLEKILERTGRMAALIQTLLEFARLSTSALAKERLDLEAMAREIFAELTAAGGRDIRLSVGRMAPCRADAVLVRQVLVNLVGNAIKYSRGRSPAVIEVGQKSLKSERGNVYFVRDNGVGFDMASAGRLFGAFERLHSAREFEGSGVGLATVKRIVQRHGGRIWAESALDAGATFYFTLPAA
jgi:signal transduction histidine kinase